MTLLEQLTRDEGKRLSPYMDCCGKTRAACTCAKPGKLTIGIGHNLDDKPISSRAALVILEDDLADAEADVAASLPWSKRLDLVRRAVLVNMAYNMGIGNLIRKNPKMLAAAERGDWTTAARHMLDGNWKSQVGARADRLAQQMETGEWC